MITPNVEPCTLPTELDGLIETFYLLLFGCSSRLTKKTNIHFIIVVRSDPDIDPTIILVRSDLAIDPTK